MTSTYEEYAEKALSEAVERCARRQWHRMTRSSIPWEDIAENDRAATRALVAPIVADALEGVAG